MRRPVALRRVGLIQAMRARHLTVAALARAVGVGERTVRSWRSGQTSPADETLPRVAKALRVTADQLDELLDADRMRPRSAIEDRIAKARAGNRAEEVRVLKWVIGEA